MQNNVKIVFLATAGIMISYKDIKILIDALQVGNEYFSSLPQKTMDNILKSRDEFKNINFLCTHITTVTI
jgi:L-ascorbate metabolism protein UlaG (beta-lactamase superfamily)